MEEGDNKGVTVSLEDVDTKLFVGEFFNTEIDAILPENFK
jgi:hypothetical protein